jgi:hypothetical protein
MPKAKQNKSKAGAAGTKKKTNPAPKKRSSGSARIDLDKRAQVRRGKK